MTELTAMLLSAAIEAPVAALGAWLAGWRGRGYAHVALAAVVATAVTHPQLWTVARVLYPYAPSWLVIAGLEVVVVLVEGLLIGWMAKLRWRQATLISVLANSASLLAGLLLGR